MSFRVDWQWSNMQTHIAYKMILIRHTRRTQPTHWQRGNCDYYIWLFDANDKSKPWAMKPVLSLHLHSHSAVIGQWALVTQYLKKSHCRHTWLDCVEISKNCSKFLAESESQKCIPCTNDIAVVLCASLIEIFWFLRLECFIRSIRIHSIQTPVNC